MHRGRLPAVSAFSSLPPGRQAEMIADPSLGSCPRNREGCIDLGPWRPFYQGYVCEPCLKADQEDVRAGRWPFRSEAG